MSWVDLLGSSRLATAGALAGCGCETRSTIGQPSVYQLRRGRLKVSSPNRSMDQGRVSTHPFGAELCPQGGRFSEPETGWADQTSKVVPVRPASKRTAG